MNELVMRLCTLVTVIFAVSTTLWLAGMVQAQQSLSVDIASAAPARFGASSAKTASRQDLVVAARSVEQAASAALGYAQRLR